MSINQICLDVYDEDELEVSVLDVDGVLRRIPKAQGKELSAKDLLEKDFDSILPLDDVKDILGRPNFACASIANFLRMKGMLIANKAADQQAAAIHYLLKLYLKHGKDYWNTLVKEVEELISKAAKDGNS